MLVTGADGEDRAVVLGGLAAALAGRVLEGRVDQEDSVVAGPFDAEQDQLRAALARQHRELVETAVAPCVVDLTEGEVDDVAVARGGALHLGGAAAPAAAAATAARTGAAACTRAAAVASSAGARTARRADAESGQRAAAAGAAAAVGLEVDSARWPERIACPEGVEPRSARVVLGRLERELRELALRGRLDRCDARRRAPTSAAAEQQHRQGDEEHHQPERDRKQPTLAQLVPDIG
ncbi:hypothetical protein HRbin41_01252 [bacterium HR41]|nr:hypothetical protein HRbin41_01252 [bacterium HR41]